MFVVFCHQLQTLQKVFTLQKNLQKTFFRRPNLLKKFKNGAQKIAELETDLKNLLKVFNLLKVGQDWHI